MPNEKLVPFNYQQKLVVTLHKWIGKCNPEHGNYSLYSFSWLKNGKKKDKGFDFADGAKWFISFYDINIIKLIIKSILEDPEMFCGMRVYDIAIEEDIDINKREKFYLASPVLIKRISDKKQKYFTYEDKDISELLKETFINKMKQAGITEDPTLEIYFDTTYEKRKKKMITYDGIKILANLCPVIIKGTENTKRFAWSCGIGNSTGIGFGSIY